MADDYNFPKGDLMKGKKGIVMGVANHNSIAFGIASQLAAQGAEMAWTYMGEALERRVRPLAESVGVQHLIQADVTDDASMDAAFAEIEAKLGTLDFVVHSIAFANKDELKGSFVDNTTREGFLAAMNVSAFSFVDVAKRAAAHQWDGRIEAARVVSGLLPDDALSPDPAKWHGGVTSWNAQFALPANLAWSGGKGSEGESADPKRTAMADLCHVLLNTSEFFYLH